ncbi:MAG: hypothetical protein IJM79_05365 [Erysipelotrichaceae bacterium]|nr:hypothetical protein [Erysipelotrichaceae bacterium]
MKKKALLIIALVMSMMLAGCGGATSKGYEFKLNGNIVKIDCETSDGYDIRKKGDNLFISKDGKDVLKGWIVFSDEWKKVNELVKSGSVDTIENTDEKIVWKQDNKICSLVSVDGMSFFYAEGNVEGDVTDDLVKEALSHLHYEWTVNTD